MFYIFLGFFILSFGRNYNDHFLLGHFVSLHILGINIFVVRAGVFLEMGVGIHVCNWGNTLAWRVQRLFVDKSSSLV